MKKCLLLLLPVLLVSGCAHSRSADERLGGFFLPEVPVFLSGPMGVLLTNAGGFSSHLTMTTGSALGQPETTAGQLLGRGDQLLFAPDPKSLDKRLRSVGLSFVWDVKANHGFVLSESLQGFAPVGFAVRYTNILSTRTAPGSERFEGHACTQEETRITSSEGATASFQVWRAADLKGFPVRLTGGPKAAPQALTLSAIRLEAPSAELFTPPESFTHYENADLLMSELTMRQHNLKRKPTEEWNERDLAPGSSAQRPR